jgi:predicted DNA-binding protein (UPF0251 family)
VSINADDPEPDVVALEAPDLTDRGGDLRSFIRGVFWAVVALYAAESPTMSTERRYHLARRAARVLFLVDFVGVTFEAAAVALGVSVSTAKSDADRGRRAVRRSDEAGGLPAPRPIPRPRLHDRHGARDSRNCEALSRDS